MTGVVIRAPSTRELECFANALVYGREEAAALLGISPRTLSHHLTSLYYKCGIEDEGRVVTAGRAAIALGWLDIPLELLRGGPAPEPISPDRYALGEQLLRYAQGIVDDLNTG